ncbi:putative hydroxymethylglutaryl-CoA lyase [Fulvimarina pelagi HTCC2506]|uniref:Putative hydroxymethylglutaryl-CoA lyase n=1 Tax=Fulvimarina pelagi HTCC2506 TaxID=314231 RepID=Q0G5K2_9HYPH|nr:hydroxymethylglutaryl-CoA lyase [Fulvimarina pelagi]EAU43062.1 putative hydroxymethylglutaryl-CoA lyase [Fulvimarina pelagi HTCC2506]
MSEAQSGTVTLLEVAPRDGFQSISDPLPTGEKILIIEDLVAAGVTRMELGSFVSPKAIPQMGDMREIAAHFKGRSGCRMSVLVPNAKGASLALEAGYPDLVFVVSVSAAHNMNNVRQTVAQSLDQLRAIVFEAGEEGAGLRVDLATSFDCPFDGTVPLDDVRRVFAEAFSIAPGAEFALCDTTGRADPITVAKRFQTVMAEAPDDTVWAFHGHDTFGMGVANALYAYNAGVTIIEGAAAGLGGCPFAPGATGNTATEDLHFAFEQGGIATGIDREKLLKAADRIAGLPGGKTASHLRIVPRERAA